MLSAQFRDFCELYSEQSDLRWIFRHSFLENLFIDSDAVTRLQNASGDEESLFRQALQKKVLKTPIYPTAFPPGGLDMGFFTTFDTIWNLFQNNRAWLIRVIVKAVLTDRLMIDSESTIDRKSLVQKCCDSRGIPKAKIYQKAHVDKSDYYRWERGELKDGSAVDQSIRRALNEM